MSLYNRLQSRPGRQTGAYFDFMRLPSEKVDVNDSRQPLRPEESHMCKAITRSGKRCGLRCATTYPFCWLHLREQYGVRVQESEAGGHDKKGLYVTQNVKKGEVIAPYSGEVLNKEQAETRYKDKQGKYLLKVPHGKVIDARKTDTDVGRYVQNAGKKEENAHFAVPRGREKQTKVAYVVADKDIHATKSQPKEIIADYGTRNREGGMRKATSQTMHSAQPHVKFDHQEDITPESKARNKKKISTKHFMGGNMTRRNMLRAASGSKKERRYKTARGEDDDFYVDVQLDSSESEQSEESSEGGINYTRDDESENIESQQSKTSSQRSSIRSKDFFNKGLARQNMYKMAKNKKKHKSRKSEQNVARDYETSPKGSAIDSKHDRSNSPIYSVESSSSDQDLTSASDMDVVSDSDVSSTSDMEVIDVDSDEETQFSSQKSGKTSSDAVLIVQPGMNENDTRRKNKRFATKQQEDAYIKEKREFWDEIFEPLKHVEMFEKLRNIKTIPVARKQDIKDNSQFCVEYINKDDTDDVFPPELMPAQANELFKKIEKWSKICEEEDNDVSHPMSFGFDKQNAVVYLSDNDTLFGNQYIDGNIISAFLLMICARNLHSKSRMPMCLAFNTAFYPALRDANKDRTSKTFDPQQMLRKTLPVHIFLYEMVFIPLHLNNNHWALFVIDNHQKQLRFYDNFSPLNLSSAEARNNILSAEFAIIRCLQFFLSELCKYSVYDKVESVFNEYTIIEMHKALKKQKNYTECGVNVMLNAYAASLNLNTLKYGIMDGSKERSKNARLIISKCIMDKHIYWSVASHGGGFYIDSEKRGLTSELINQRRQLIEEHMDVYKNYWNGFHE
jgi:hypothetical protein